MCKVRTLASVLIRGSLLPSILHRLHRWPFVAQCPSLFLVHGPLVHSVVHCCSFRPFLALCPSSPLAQSPFMPSVTYSPSLMSLSYLSVAMGEGNYPSFLWTLYNLKLYSVLAYKHVSPASTHKGVIQKRIPIRQIK